MRRGCYEPIREIDVVGLKPSQALRNCTVNIFTIVPDLATSFGRYMVSEFRIDYIKVWRKRKERKGENERGRKRGGSWERKQSGLNLHVHDQCHYHDEGFVGNVVPSERASISQLHGLPDYHGEEDFIRYQQEGHWCHCGH